MPGIIIGIGGAIASFFSSLSSAEFIAVAVGALAGFGLIFTPANTKNPDLPARNEVYDYSQIISDALFGSQKRRTHVHHIVPANKFSNRSTSWKVEQMHDKLSSVGINRHFDPVNLMVVSDKTHASLHTDKYISHVHSYIMAAEDKADVYAAMFWLRLEIAAWDALIGGF